MKMTGDIDTRAANIRRQTFGGSGKNLKPFDQLTEQQKKHWIDLARSMAAPKDLDQQ